MRKQRTDSATNQGERENDDKQTRNIREETLMIKEGRRHGNHNADDAVIHCLGFRDAVDRIGAESDYNRRKVSAEHCRNDRTRTVQVKRDTEHDSKARRNKVQRQTYQNEKHRRNQRRMIP